jgi:MYXO-CTERM domain-containing protein
MPRDTDGDRTIDALDNDDDGDGILTRDELGTGGAMMPRNSDATVPMAEGTSDAAPDYLDNDDDGDGIPTAVERTLDTSANDDRDGDMVPSHLDRDSDGDGDFDREEAGATPAMPANTDGLTDGPDFLDTDSDNDCAGDRDTRENGAARVTVPTPVDGNCSGATPVCDRTASVCVACLVTGGMSRGCATSTAGRVCIVPGGDAGAAMSFCGCRLDGDCAMDQVCNPTTSRCVMRAMPDAGPDVVTDAGTDAAVDVASDLGADTGADTGVDAAPDVAMDAAVDVVVEDVTVTDVAVEDAASDAAVDALADAVPPTDGPAADTGTEDSGAEDVATTDATPTDDTGPVADGGVPAGGVEYRGGGCACSVPNGTAPSHSNALFLLGLGVIPALIVRRRRAARRERGASPS